MRLTFGAKIGLAIFFLSLVTSGLGLFWFYRMASRTVLEQMQTRMLDLAHTGSYIFSEEDRKLMSQLKKELNSAIRYKKEEVTALEEEDTMLALSEAQIQAFQSRPDFERLIQRLRRIRAGSRTKIRYPHPFSQKPEDPKDVSRVKYAYLLYPLPGLENSNASIFLGDSDYEELDVNGNGKIDEDETANPIGNIYILDEDAFRAASQGRVAVAEEWYTDKWGTWLSSFAPILDKNGTPIAVLGLDLDVSGAANRLSELEQFLWTAIITSLLLSIVVSMLLALFLQRPIKKLQKGAEEVAARNFSYRVELKSKDELGKLAEAFNSMVSEIGDYAQNLEQKVAERTAELQATLEKVEALKKQQDGDYYLTNLLANPLFRNWNTSKQVYTDFLIRQKKRFRFRKWDGQLGGDLCITSNLRLRARDYTMLLNADAMGKSMQGAGGALVMGTVVKSILQRATISPEGLAKSPEQWLREIFQELHGVFLTFDGSMAISCVLGLIDNLTGVFLYFNAEHPYPVIYRNGKARFIQEDIHYNKLGMMQRTDDLPMLSYELRPDDRLILGSDGRDDILIQKADGSEAMNYDEFLFLRHVEEGKGEIEKIATAIERKGTITDDLTLLCAVFEPSSAPRSSKEVLLDFSEIYELVRKKQFEEVLSRLQDVHIEEQGLLYHYYMGLCLHKTGQSEKALEYLEKATELNRSQAVVPGLLGWVYKSLGRKEDARREFEKSLRLDPQNERIKKALATL